MRNFAVFSLFLIIVACSTNSLLVAQTDSIYTIADNLDDYEVEFHNIKIDILNQQEVNIAERYEIRNMLTISVNSVSLWINQSLENLVVSDSEGRLTTEINKFSDASNLLKIDFRTGLSANSTTVFNVWYSLVNKPIPEQGNSYYLFEFHSSVTYFTKEQKIEIKLPEKSLIHEEEGITSFYPILADPIAGRRIYISWSFIDLSTTDSTFVFIRFDKPLGEFPIWTVIVGPLLGIGVGTSATVYFMRRKSKKVMKKVATIYLSDTQKLLLKLISENNGKILQKELCAKTGFTKSRISRNITPLVEQGLVNRDKWGRNYIITLSASGEKVVE